MTETNQELRVQRLPIDKSINQLTIDQVKLINQALTDVGDFGEVRLVIERGQLHYLVTQKSINVRNKRHGMISKDYE